MAYYDALINAWSTTPNPPAGVTGTGITSTQTTAAKLANIDGWTVTGVVPVSIVTNGAALANCIVFSEFNALSSAQQAQLLWLCAIGAQSGGLLGGSTNVGLLTAGLFLSCFSSLSVTRANLTALAKATVTPWWQSVGYPAPFSQTDLSLAGLS